MDRALSASRTGGVDDSSGCAGSSIEIGVRGSDGDGGIILMWRKWNVD